jgi:hypothetical protein
VEIKELVIDSTSINGETADVITVEITKTLEQDGLHLEHCRCQVYGNYATISGVHSIFKNEFQICIFWQSLLPA